MIGLAGYLTYRFLKAESSPDQSRALGNEEFRKKNYKNAIKLYRQAISSTIELSDLAKLYQNISACQDHLKQYPESFESVIQALKFDSSYEKAWKRLTKYVEQYNSYCVRLSDYEKFVYIMACNFNAKLSSKNLQKVADEVLKSLCESKSQNIYDNKMGKLPSTKFIENFLKTFKGFESEEFFRFFSKPFQTQFDDLKKESTGQEIAFATYLSLASDFKPALEIFNDILKTSKNDKELAFCHIQIALCWTQMSNHSMAFEHFAKALDISPNQDAYYNRAQLKIGMNDLDSAIKDLKSCLKINPTHSLANAYIILCQFQEAIEKNDLEKLENSSRAFQLATVKFPDCTETIALHAQTESMRGNWERAIEIFDTAIMIDPRCSQAMVHKAIILETFDRIYFLNVGIRPNIRTRILAVKIPAPK